MAVTIILSIISLALSIFLILYAFNLYSLFWKTLIKKEAPFVSLSRNILDSVAKELVIKNGNVVYDLGCGNGRVLFFLAQKYPAGRYVGVEKNVVPFILAKLNHLRRGRPENIKIVKQDMFACDFSEATHIFTYLFPEHMEWIYEKLGNKFKKGTRLVSCAFSFKRKKPEKIVEIPQKGIFPPRHKKIYVYEF